MNQRHGGQPGAPDPLVELELTNDALRKIRKSCFEKCMKDSNEMDLSEKEKKCNDNCVMKYFDAMKLIAHHFQEQEKVELAKEKAKGK